MHDKILLQSPSKMAGLLLAIIFIFTDRWNQGHCKHNNLSFLILDFFFNPGKAKVHSQRINNYNCFKKITWDISRSP